MSLNSSKTLLLLISISFLAGCAEGPLWRTGYLSPWVRQKWSDEEQVAAGLFTKRRQMKEIVENATDGGADAQEEASKYLANVVANDSILLLRIEATRLLANLPTETAGKALEVASRDRQVEVRRAAVRSWEKRGDEMAKTALTRMVRKDGDVDVRIAATVALGQFSGQSVTEVLAEVIQDPNPAMQLRAAESLAATTGEDFGNDILAWQEYLKRTLPDTGKASPTGSFLSTQPERSAGFQAGSSFR